MVKTNYHIHQVLTNPNLEGRMLSWTVELLEYDIRYIPKGSIKSHVLDDFLVEFNLTIVKDASLHGCYQEMVPPN